MTKRQRPSAQRIILGIIAAILLIAPVFLLQTGSAAAIDEINPVGLVDGTLNDTARQRELNYYVWYPTDSIGLVEMVAENAVFHGFSAIEGAGVDSGTYPLVILSHGSGGNRANQGWLAVELARQGMIVVAANHPGSTSMDSAPETNILTWNRPADISFLIDSMLADERFAPHIDAERIAVVGHSLGGYTALAVGGAELSLDRFITYCDDFSHSPDCAFYRDGGVDLTQVDRTQFEQSNRDERVKAVVAIDPAYARSFTAESLDAMSDTLLIAAGADGGFDTDIKVDSLADELALGEDFMSFEHAHHFTFLPECKAIGFYVLKVMEKDGELLCWPEEGRSRAEYHDDSAELIINFLTRQAILTAQ